MPNNNRVEMLPNRTKFTNESRVIVTALCFQCMGVCVCALCMCFDHESRELADTNQTKQQLTTRLLTFESYINFASGEFCVKSG